MFKNRILLIADNYPSRESGTRGVFVFNLVQEFSKKYTIDVVVPVSTFNHTKLAHDKAHVTYARFQGLSYLTLRHRWAYRFVSASKKLSVMRCIDISVEYEFVYCHFISSCLPIIDYVRNRGFPLFVAMGESTLDTRYRQLFRDSSRMNELLSTITGVVTVSEQLKRLAQEKFNFSADSILVAQNGANQNIFNHLEVEKVEFDSEMNEVFIAFTGAFIERKGFHVLMDAVSEIEGVKLVLIGRGEVNMNSDKIAFAGSLDNVLVPSFLKSCDMFVFPSLAEGSSNAIAEAISCGLPIITTRIPEILEQVGENNALFAEPNDVSSLRRCIIQFVENEGLRQTYSQRSKALSSVFSLEGRAKRILTWIEAII